MGSEKRRSRFAEEANYWATTVHPAKSQAEISERLEEFGATNRSAEASTEAQPEGRSRRSLVVAQGRAGECLAWMMRFEWNEATYRFTFVPLECRHPDKVSSFGGKRRSHSKQAEYQMGRVAVHFVKAILTCPGGRCQGTAAEAHPHALFGFVELPEAQTHPNGLPFDGAHDRPYTAGELNVAGLTAALPPLDVGMAVRQSSRQAVRQSSFDYAHDRSRQAIYLPQGGEDVIEGEVEEMR